MRGVGRGIVKKEVWGNVLGVITHIFRDVGETERGGESRL